MRHTVSPNSVQCRKRTVSSSQGDDDGGHDFFSWEQKYSVSSGPKRLAEL